MPRENPQKLVVMVAILQLGSILCTSLPTFMRLDSRPCRGRLG